jgi:hypothetical protein
MISIEVFEMEALSFEMAKKLQFLDLQLSSSFHDCIVQLLEIVLTKRHQLTNQLKGHIFLT